MLFRHRLFVIAFLFCYCSIALFYDFRVLSARRVMSGFSIESFFLFWAAILVPFISFLILKIPFDKRLNSFIIFYAVYVIWSLMIGVISQNEVASILGDFYKSLFIPAGLGLYNLTKNNTSKFYESAAKILILYATLRILTFLYLGTPINRIYYGTVYDVLMFGFIGIFLSERKRLDAKKVLPNFFYSFYPLVIVLLGQKKLVILSLIGFLPARLKARNLWLPVILIGFLSLYWKDVLSFVSTTRLSAFLNYEEIFYGESRRIAEVKACLNAWQENISSFFLGHGFGSDIFVYSEKEAYSIEVHSIHNSTFATIFRSGIIGLFVILMFLTKLLSSIISDSGQKNVAATMLAALIACQFAYGFMDQVFVGYLFAHLKLGNPRFSTKSF